MNNKDKKVHCFTSYLRIGKGIWKPKNYEKCFRGYIDDILIYERALSRSEIEVLYEEGKRADGKAKNERGAFAR